MNRFTRNAFSLCLLWLAASALVSTLKTSILYIGEAPFLPIMVPAMMLAYLLGMGSWPTRRAWTLLLWLASPYILLQASHTLPAMGQILLHLPSLLWDPVVSFFTGEFVDRSVFQIQLEQIALHLESFRQGLLWNSDGRSMTLIELSWDIPLYFVGAWSGWWSSRRNSILIALIPSVGIQVYLLLYAHRPEKMALQIGVFILIFLMGFHQKWSLSQSESTSHPRVRMETHAMLFVFSFVLVVAAGSTPIVPAPEKPIRPPKKQATSEPVDKSPATNHIGVTAGFPNDYVINTPPKDMIDVIFLANTGQTPLADESEKGSEPPAPFYYWRWITYDQYNGNVWSSSATTITSYPADQALFEFNQEAQGYRLVHQTILKASDGDDHLYWTGSLIDADQPIDATWRMPPPAENPLLGMDMLGSLTPAKQYSADSLLPQFSETQLQSASQVYPTEILQKYLSLPDTISQRVRDLAATLTVNAQNPYDKARAIETYLRTYPYTLDVPIVPADREITDYFLFELKKGFCEYYATSMVVLARSAGLPARIVIGYASSEYDAHSAQYIVRRGHAHTWVEIYFPQIGWVEFEPTANLPLAQRVQPAEVPDVPRPVESTQKSRLDVPHKKHGYYGEHRPIVARILLFLLAVAGVCLWFLGSQGLWFSYQTIGSIYTYIYRHGRRILRDAPPNATPSLFAEGLQEKLRLDHPFLLHAADELDYLTSLYIKEIYSPHRVTAVEHRWAVKIWYRLFWRLLYVRVLVALRGAVATKQSPPK